MGIQPEPSPMQEQVNVKVMSSEISPNQFGHGAVPVAPTQPNKLPCLCVSLCKTSSRKRQVEIVLHFMLLLHMKFALYLNPNLFFHRFHPTVTSASPTSHSQQPHSSTHLQSHRSRGLQQRDRSIPTCTPALLLPEDAPTRDHFQQLLCTSPTAHALTMLSPSPSQASPEQP